MAVTITKNFWNGAEYKDISKIVFTSPNFDSPAVAGTRSHMPPGGDYIGTWFEAIDYMYRQFDDQAYANFPDEMESFFGKLTLSGTFDMDNDLSATFYHDYGDDYSVTGQVIKELPKGAQTPIKHEDNPCSGNLDSHNLFETISKSIRYTIALYGSWLDSGTHYIYYTVSCSDSDENDVLNTHSTSYYVADTYIDDSYQYKHVSGVQTPIWISGTDSSSGLQSFGSFSYDDIIVYTITFNNDTTVHHFYESYYTITSTGPTIEQDYLSSNQTNIYVGTCEDSNTGSCELPIGTVDLGLYGAKVNIEYILLRHKDEPSSTVYKVECFPTTDFLVPADNFINDYHEIGSYGLRVKWDDINGIHIEDEGVPWIWSVNCYPESQIIPTSLYSNVRIPLPESGNIYLGNLLTNGTFTQSISITYTVNIASVTSKGYINDGYYFDSYFSVSSTGPQDEQDYFDYYGETGPIIIGKWYDIGIYGLQVKWDSFEGIIFNEENDSPSGWSWVIECNAEGDEFLNSQHILYKDKNSYCIIDSYTVGTE